MGSKPFATPLRADVVEGEVVLTAPDAATAVSLTPEAAMATAEQLQRAAKAARLEKKKPQAANAP